MIWFFFFLRLFVSLRAACFLTENRFIQNFFLFSFFIPLLFFVEISRWGFQEGRQHNLTLKLIHVYSPLYMCYTYIYFLHFFFFGVSCSFLLRSSFCALNLPFFFFYLWFDPFYFIFLSLLILSAVFWTIFIFLIFCLVLTSFSLTHGTSSSSCQTVTLRHSSSSSRHRPSHPPHPRPVFH